MKRCWLYSCWSVSIVPKSLDLHDLLFGHLHELGAMS